MTFYQQNSFKLQIFPEGKSKNNKFHWCLCQTWRTENNYHTTMSVFAHFILPRPQIQ